MIDSDHRPRPTAEATLLEVDGATVVFDRGSGAAHALNETAALLWRVFDGEGTIAEIAADVADAFDVPAEAALDDVSNLVDQLGRIGALEGIGARHPADPVAPDDCDDDETPVERDPFSEPPYIAVPPNN
ncbi:MAG: HPr-rel-A system PqqD family peptide chaperone [Acidimicrobiales bacterium]